jgi:hypothetical protein
MWFRLLFAIIISYFAFRNNHYEVIIQCQNSHYKFNKFINYFKHCDVSDNIIPLYFSHPIFGYNLTYVKTRGICYKYEHVYHNANNYTLADFKNHSYDKNLIVSVLNDQANNAMLECYVQYK